MNQEQVRELFEKVRTGEVSPEVATERLKHMPFEDLDFAKVDHHRSLRHGMPEVIFGQGKTPEQIASIAASLAARGQNVLATRVVPEGAAAVQAMLPEAEYYPLSRVLILRREVKMMGKGKIVVMCAGTADLPVAEEARLVAELMGNEVDAISDVGVAGIHRLLEQRERLWAARVIICCAGMEAALPSAVGGLVGCPVIGVPTSVGYGAHFNGLASLLSMLNSCASNVTTVNIDNGFGAAYVAALINRI
ncbi:nickel pincer cofactor biosynthesis protein LarB [Bryobacter aggregatus]|uniref:nickel pincer cofactor biosynthesis protein LarB n=1 Tax=Bryobacter aggregatus TaxID=360054 RepID=UPI0004E11996|nr:nickel pincer cofactor biosynthesis protein LarB [Bryobacter aggregatus]